MAFFVAYMRLKSDPFSKKAKGSGDVPLDQNRSVFQHEKVIDFLACVRTQAVLAVFLHIPRRGYADSGRLRATAWNP